MEYVKYILLDPVKGDDEAADRVVRASSLAVAYLVWCVMFGRRDGGWFYALVGGMLSGCVHDGEKMGRRVVVAIKKWLEE